MIPDRARNEAQLSATLSADQRKKVLDRVLATLQKRFYAPEKLNGDWQAAVGRHRPLIEAANTPADFEKEVSDLLKELLQTSHLGFFHRSARRASSRAAPGVRPTWRMRQSMANAGSFKMCIQVAQLPLRVRRARGHSFERR